MEGGSLDSDQDLGFGFGSLRIKLGLADGLVPQTHGSGQEGGHDIYKGFDFLRVRELLFEVLDHSEQMGITILERARGMVIPGVTIHDEEARQRVIS